MITSTSSRSTPSSSAQIWAVAVVAAPVPISVAPIMSDTDPSSLTLTPAAQKSALTFGWNLPFVKCVPHATPTPRPGCGFATFSRQPMASAAFSRHSAMPQLVRVGPLIALSPGRDRFLSRNSTASIPSRSAIMSVWLSAAKVNCGPPSVEGSTERVVGVHGVAVVPIGRDAVHGAAEHRLGEWHTRPVRGVGAVVENDPGRPGGDRAVVLDPGFHVDDLGVAGAAGGELFGREWNIFTGRPRFIDA